SEDIDNHSNYQLKLLKNLYDDGILTQGEYIQKRDKIINELVPSDYQSEQEIASNTTETERKTESVTRNNSNHFFSIHGRLNRGRYFLYNYVVNISVVLFVLLFAYLGIIVSEVVIDIARLFMLANIFIQSIKRFHDLGKSGWQVLFLLIPILNFITILNLLLTPGETETNKYGENPIKPKNNLKRETIT
ncbi:MAG: DUF805 domain-containing protein, partial [Clostridiaceae bacterium]|nr:DUF805 domain-containing protein [Clostridiaceae bacterium]